MKKINNYINGNIVNYSSKYIDVDNPSTGEIEGEVLLSKKRI